MLSKLLKPYLLIKKDIVHSLEFGQSTKNEIVNRDISVFIGTMSESENNESFKEIIATELYPIAVFWGQLFCQ